MLMCWVLIKACGCVMCSCTQNPDFTPDNIGRVSGAARGLCLWVRAMETYGHVAKDVAPKRAKLKAAQVRARNRSTDWPHGADSQLLKHTERINGRCFELPARACACLCVCFEQDTLAKKQAALKAAQEALATVLAKVQALKDK